MAGCPCHRGRCCLLADMPPPHPAPATSIWCAFAFAFVTQPPKQATSLAAGLCYHDWATTCGPVVGAHQAASGRLLCRHEADQPDDMCPVFAQIVHVAQGTAGRLPKVPNGTSVSMHAWLPGAKHATHGLQNLLQRQHSARLVGHAEFKLSIADVSRTMCGSTPARGWAYAQHWKTCQCTCTSQCNIHACTCFVCIRQQVWLNTCRISASFVPSPGRVL